MLHKKKGILLTLAFMLIFSSIFAACGRSENNEGQTGTETEEGTEVSPQELHLLLGAEPPTLDAQITTDGESFIILNAVQEGLVRVGENGKIEPGMAESWEISEDGLTYTFHLRENAVWSNGDPITTQSFIDSWERVINAANASQYASLIYDYIKGAKAYYDYTNYLVLKDLYENNREKYEEANKQEDGTVPTPDVVAFGEARTDITPVTFDSVGVKALDEHTLQVELISPTAWFLELTAFSTYLPFNKAFFEQTAGGYASEIDKLLFNGPFVMSEWLHESKIVLTKNEQYWDKDTVKLERVTFDIVKDSGTALALYESGEVDRTGLSRENVALYQDDPNFGTFAEMVSAYLVFNTQKKPFNNPKVRKALSIALDRQGYVDTILNNGSEPAFGLVPKGFKGYEKTFREESEARFGGPLFTDNQVEEAKKLLNEGLTEEGIDPVSFTFELLGSDTETGRKSDEFLKTLWKQTLGFDISIKGVPFAERLNRQRAGNFDVSTSLWGPDYNDPLTWMFLFETGGTYNDGRYSNPEYDALVAKARTETNLEARNNYFLDAEKLLIQDDMAIAPLYFRNLAHLQRPYVKNLYQRSFGSDFEFKWAYIEGK